MSAISIPWQRNCPISPKPILFLIQESVAAAGSAIRSNPKILMGSGGDAKQSEVRNWVVHNVENAAPPVKEWFLEHSAEPDTVRRFCSDNRILIDAVRAVAQAKKHFHGAKPALWIEQDTDSDARWLIVDVPCAAAITEPLAAYDALLDEWITSTTPNVLSLIHLTFTVA
jgi:hypothetical protein